MALTTYAELQTAIDTWLNRDDLSATAPDFIKLAEAQLQRDVRHWKGEATTTISLTSRFTDVPSDLNETLRIQIDLEKRPLQLVNAYEMQELRSYSNDTAGRPKYYAMIAGQYEVYPTPDETYTASVYYRANIPALADDNTSNWLLEVAPDAYLYGSLAQSAPFLVEDQRLQMWANLYQNSIATLNNQSERATHGGTVRMRIK